MRKMIYQKWWKYIGILILFYVFVAGFIVPLRPGILEVSLSRLVCGQNADLNIVTYNTQFDQSTSDLQVFLKLDSTHVLRADHLEVISRKEIKATFEIPRALPSDDQVSSATLIVADINSGYLIMPSAVVIAADTSSYDMSASWDDQISHITTDWAFAFPFRGILYETIRNTFFHVAIWFAMFILLIISLIYSIRYLKNNRLDDDAMASSFTTVAVVFGLIGMATGSIWAKNTWGTYWTNDPKLNMSAVALMIYLAYLILRSSVNGDDRKARVSAAYNIFAFAAMIPLIFIIPRLTSSLHPGNGGNPALGGEDLDNTLRLVFYPAIIGLTILGTWLSGILYRVKMIQINFIDKGLYN